MALLLCSSRSLRSPLEAIRLVSNKTRLGQHSRGSRLFQLRKWDSIQLARATPDQEDAKSEQQESAALEKFSGKLFRSKLWLVFLTLSLTAFIAGYLYFFITNNGADQVPIMKYTRTYMSD